MWKKIAIGGTVAAAILGVGTASLAVTGDTPTTAGTGSSAPGFAAPNGAPGHRHGHPGLGRELAGRTLHGQFVTRDPKTKAFVTHDVIHGTVTAVSATSITVKAADNVSFTYTVNGDTAVRMHTAGKRGAGTKSAIGNVKSGDKVLVLGTGTSAPYVAKHIVDGVS